MTDEQENPPEDFPNAEEFFGNMPGFEVVEELSIQTILESTERTLNERGWDRPPVLAFVRGNDLGAETSELVLPPVVAEDLPTHFPRFAIELLKYIGYHRTGGPDAEFIKILQEEFLGPSFQGIILSSEGWTVDQPDKETEPAKWAEWQHAYEHGKFHEHPDRIEARMTALLTPEGDYHQIYRLRDKEPVYTETSGKDWEEGQQGAIPEAMRMFMLACITLQMFQGLVNEGATTYWKNDMRKSIQRHGDHVQGLKSLYGEGEAE